DAEQSEEGPGAPASLESVLEAAVLAVPEAAAVVDASSAPEPSHPDSVPATPTPAEEPDNALATDGGDFAPAPQDELGDDATLRKPKTAEAGDVDADNVDTLSESSGEDDVDVEPTQGAVAPTADAAASSDDDSDSSIGDALKAAFSGPDMPPLLAPVVDRVVDAVLASVNTGALVAHFEAPASDEPAAKALSVDLTGAVTTVLHALGPNNLQVDLQTTAAIESAAGDIVGKLKQSGSLSGANNPAHTAMLTQLKGALASQVEAFKEAGGTLGEFSDAESSEADADTAAVKALVLEEIKGSEATAAHDAVVAVNEVDAVTADEVNAVKGLGHKTPTNEDDTPAAETDTAKSESWFMSVVNYIARAFKSLFKWVESLFGGRDTAEVEVNEVPVEENVGQGFVANDAAVTVGLEAGVKPVLSQAAVVAAPVPAQANEQEVTTARRKSTPLD
ncbi:MAG: hypothetical protein V4490_05655, partial [Pseudomonadota bacterium]